MASWGYEKHNGPDHWAQWFPVAKTGSRQSPIDLDESLCDECKALPPLIIKYSPIAGLKLENTGASWKVNFAPELTSLTGGPLSGEYRLVQMHAHWGAQEGRGSEHTLNGKMFDGELHLVHYNTAYGSFAEAADKPDGLGVIGVFLQVGEEETDPQPELAKVTRLLDQVSRKGDAVDVEEEIDAAQLIPEGCECYFTYPGSLTTPPLYESVTFMIYREPMLISKEQMERMRSMLCGEDADCPCLVDNYRPVCPRGNRKLRKAIL